MIKIRISFGLLSKIIRAQKVDAKKSSADSCPDHKCCCSKAHQHLGLRFHMQISHAFLSAKKHPALGEIARTYIV